MTGGHLGCGRSYTCPGRGPCSGAARHSLTSSQATYNGVHLKCVECFVCLLPLEKKERKTEKKEILIICWGVDIRLWSRQRKEREKEDFLTKIT